MYGILEGDRDWAEVKLQPERAALVDRIAADGLLEYLCDEQGFAWAHPRADVREMKSVIADYDAERAAS